MWWLNARFDGQFISRRDEMPHGIQDDYTECGICCPNTIACDTIGGPLWTSSRKGFEHVNWFKALYELYKKISFN
jgi:hypothetical protein